MASLVNEIVRAVKDIDDHIANLMIMKEELLYEPAQDEFNRVLADEEWDAAFDGLAPCQLMGVSVILMRHLRHAILAATEQGMQ